MSSVLILNGVNLGSLGSRRPEVYGGETLEDIEKRLKGVFTEAALEFRQTDYEGEMVAWIRDAPNYDGLVINPGAWTHYAYALHDALETLDVPKVEVHISNVHHRETWRRVSVVSPAVDAVVAGMSVHGYEAAIRYILARGTDSS